LDGPTVRAISNASNTLFVLSNLGDSVELGSEWTLSGVTVEDGIFYRVLEQNDTKLFLNGPANWQNPVDHRDVNNNGVAGDPVGDILALINEVNRKRIVSPTGLLPEQPVEPHLPVPFYDVNGDGLLTPVGDILSQINFVNSQIGLEGEAPAPSANIEPANVERRTVNMRLRRTSNVERWTLNVEGLDFLRSSMLDVRVDVEGRQTPSPNVERRTLNVEVRRPSFLPLLDAGRWTFDVEWWQAPTVDVEGLDFFRRSMLDVRCGTMSGQARSFETKGATLDVLHRKTQLCFPRDLATE
jgi:hypothetical protein